MLTSLSIGDGVLYFLVVLLTVYTVADVIKRMIP